MPVLGGSLSVMKVWEAKSKFKTTPYYPVHPLILLDTYPQKYRCVQELYYVMGIYRMAVIYMDDSPHVFVLLLVYVYIMYINGCL